jgi:two-component system, LytTR family, sensor kinase
MVMITWGINIYLILNFEYKKRNENKKRYFLSYVSVTVFIVFTLILGRAMSAPTEDEFPSIVFPFINGITLNTIILIISNTIVIRSKKIQVDEELANLKIKHLEAEHQQLIQQLQPHFLFNSLSTLKSLIRNDTELAEEYLIKLADFFRFTISVQENKTIPLLDELKFTSDYIDLQQIRFSNSLYSEIHIPEEIRYEYSIPVYALQTLAENAIKHNAFTEEYPLKLSITYYDGSLIISNNKIPKPSNNNRIGVGLENLNKRYLLFGGGKIKINETPQTFSVIIKLIKPNVC